MISASELRLGNWVNLNDGSGVDDFRQVIGYSEGCLWTLVSGCRFAQRHLRPDEVFAIPLTREILSSCGFTWDDDGHYFHEDLGEDIVLWIFNSQSMRVKYLHQLQNLFYELVGEELKIDI